MKTLNCLLYYFFFTTFLFANSTIGITIFDNLEDKASVKKLKNATSYVFSNINKESKVQKK